MSTRLRSAAIICFGLLASSQSMASGTHTVSIGYAQTHLSTLKSSDSKDLHGLNIKYRYEFNERWGFIGALTATRHEVEHYSWQSAKLKKEGSDTIDYSSVMVGPTYRFNEYISLYGNAGMARMKMKNTHSHESTDDSFAYGAGVIFNPLTNLSLDLSWEASKFFSVDANTFGVSVGYRF